MPKVRTNAEVRYHGTAMLLGMAFLIEDQTVFESASAGTRHDTMGFLTHREARGRGLGRGPHALRRIAASSVRFRARTLFKLVMKRHPAI
jgi:hypothetical protein